jgi:transcriptional regulator with XRE-family HTH domain
MEMKNIQIGEQIRHYRTKLGISQEALALMADLNPAYIGQIERGIKSPTVNTVKKIANALGINLHTLFTPISEAVQGESELRKREMEKIMLFLNRLDDRELLLLSQTITDIINFRKLP